MKYFLIFIAVLVLAVSFQYTKASEESSTIRKCAYRQTCGTESLCQGDYSVCGDRSYCAGEFSSCGAFSTCSGENSRCGPNSKCTNPSATCA